MRESEQEGDRKGRETETRKERDIRREEEGSKRKRETKGREPTAKENQQQKKERISSKREAKESGMKCCCRLVQLAKAILSSVFLRRPFLALTTIGALVVVVPGEERINPNVFQ